MIKITDEEIEQICMQLKRWAKDRNTPRASNTTVPSQTVYSYQYSFKIPNITPSSNYLNEESYTNMSEIIKRMENTAKGLMDAGVTNFALSLKSEIEDLMKLLWGVKE